MRHELAVQEIKDIALEVLKVIAQICDDQGFRYFLIYGTLIGAVRHHGYIPWDDDVDIMMPRPDYERFLQYFKAHNSEYPNLRIFNCEECEEYPYMITRVSDDRYRIDMANEKPYGMGIFVDIYPYDGLGKTKSEALRYGMKGDRLSSLCFQATRKRFAIETTTSVIRKFIKYPVYLVSKLIGKEYFQKKLKCLAGQKDYDMSEYIGCVVWLSGGEKDIYLKRWFDEAIMMQFEKYQFRVPKYYDEVLRHGYGDYMKLPPEKERIGHHYYKAYKV